MKHLTKQQIIEALGVNKESLVKIAQLTAREIRLKFDDGHSAIFKTSRPVKLVD